MFPKILKFIKKKKNSNKSNNNKYWDEILEEDLEESLWSLKIRPPTAYSIPGFVNEKW